MVSMSQKAKLENRTANTRRLRNVAPLRMADMGMLSLHLPCLPCQQSRWPVVSVDRIGMKETDSADGHDRRAKRAGRPAAGWAEVFRSRLASCARPAVSAGDNFLALPFGRTAGFGAGR